MTDEVEDHFKCLYNVCHFSLIFYTKKPDSNAELKFNKM